MKHLGIFLRGLLMGICDVIPGISGGTIAFITGIYDELLDALHGFNMDSLYAISRGNISTFWKNIHGTFLTTLLLGIITAIALLANIITYIIEHYPLYIRSFFIGLILSSSIILLQKIKSRSLSYPLRFIVGIIIGRFITGLPLMGLTDSLFSLFTSGALAIIAMILPGISGSYILLILGQYERVLGIVVQSTDAVKNIDINMIPIAELTVFIVGICLGLLIFSRILYCIKERYHDQMVLTLSGFMLGSLQAIRPWKEIAQSYITEKGIEKVVRYNNILRPNHQELIYAIIFIIIGFSLVLLIQKSSTILKKRYGIK